MAEQAVRGSVPGRGFESRRLRQNIKDGEAAPALSIKLAVMSGGAASFGRQTLLGSITGRVEAPEEKWRTLSLWWHPQGGDTETITVDRWVRPDKIDKTIGECAAFIGGELIDGARYQKLLNWSRGARQRWAKWGEEQRRAQLKKLHAGQRRWRDKETAEERHRRLEAVRLGAKRWWAGVTLEEEEARREKQRRNQLRRWARYRSSEAAKKSFRKKQSAKLKAHWASLTPEERAEKIKHMQRTKRGRGRPRKKPAAEESAAGL